MRIAFLGTGFVADYYMTTLANHPGLTLAGAFDADAARLGQFCTHHSVRRFDGIEALLAADDVELIVNLTSPQSHFDTSLAALDAGKHVYSEKPLAMALNHAKTLVAKARDGRRVLAGAPANALSDAFSLTKATIKAGAVGTPRLVYVEMEDGPVFRQNWRNWRSASDAPWPGAHEFEIGCILEHAGYALTWLIGLFGPIRSIAGHSGVMFRDKGVKVTPEDMGPDYASASLVFDAGVTARLTCGLSAPRNRSLTVMGEDGTITVADLWDHRSAVYLEKAGENPPLAFRAARRIEARLGRALAFIPASGRRLGYAPGGNGKILPAYPSQIDFTAGIQAAADCAAGSGSKSSERLAAEALHVTEAALALNDLAAHGGSYAMTTEFPFGRD